MASVIGDLVARFNMDNSPFKRKVAESQGILKKFAGSTISTMRSLAGAFAPIGGAVAFAGIIRSGETFNQKMLQSLAIMGDVSDAMKGEMREAAFEVGKTTRFSAEEAAKSFYYLASAGLSAGQSLKAMPQVAMFAQAGNFDMARATELAGDAQAAMGMQSLNAQKNLENLTRVTDVLTKANVLAQATTEQFSVALTSKAAASARSVGKDIEETVAILATFAKQGTKAEEAGTRLHMVLRDMQTKAIVNAEAFRRYGISIFDSGGEMRDMADIVENLEETLAGFSDRTKKATLLELGFTDRSVAGILQLLGMSGEIRRFEEELRKAGGTTKEVADKMLTPWQKLWAWISASSTQLGTKIMGAINTALAWLGKFKDDFLAVGKSIWSFWTATWSQIGSIVGGVLETLGFTAIGFENTVHAVLQNIAGFFDTLGFTARNIWDLAKIAVIDFALKYLEVWPQLEAPIEGLGATFVGTWSGIQAFFGSVIDNMIGGLKELWNWEKAVFSFYKSLIVSILNGDLAGAMETATNELINTLSSQENITAPNAFKEFQKAFTKASGEFQAKVATAGGMTGFLRETRQGILDEIAKREASKTILGRTIDSATAASRIDTGIAPIDRPIPSKEKTELPGILERGSQEAYKKIVQSMYGGSKKDKVAERTARSSEITANLMQELVDQEKNVLEIP